MSAPLLALVVIGGLVSLVGGIVIACWILGALWEAFLNIVADRWYAKKRAAEEAERRVRTHPFILRGRGKFRTHDVDVMVTLSGEASLQVRNALRAALQEKFGIDQ